MLLPRLGYGPHLRTRSQRSPPFASDGGDKDDARVGLHPQPLPKRPDDNGGLLCSHPARIGASSSSMGLGNRTFVGEDMGYMRSNICPRGRFTRVSYLQC